MSTIEKSTWAAAILILCACDGPPHACPPCGDDEACVRGVCIATCGGDVSGFDAALGEGLTPVANFCRPASGFTVRDGGAIEVWDLTSQTEGTSTTLTLSRWALDPSTPTPQPTVVGTVTHDTMDASVSTFPGGFVALDPSGDRALFGYTSTADGYPGTVVVVSDTGATTEIAAPSNFDAAWLDADRFIVSGTGLGDASEGAGLYVGDATMDPPAASHAVTGLAIYSGSVVVGSSYVVAGSSDDAYAPHDYAITTDAIDAAISGGTALDAANDAVALVDPDGATPPSTFSDVGARIVTTPYGGPLTSYAVDAASGALSDPRVIATGDTFTDAAAAGEGRILLAHGGGFLLVSE